MEECLAQVLKVCRGIVQKHMQQAERLEQEEYTVVGIRKRRETPRRDGGRAPWRWL